MNSPDGPIPSERAILAGARKRISSGPARLIFVTGMAISLFMSLISFLDQRTGGMLIFGFIALVFFLLLMRPSGRSSAAGNDS
jgi:hypothetical protein